MALELVSLLQASREAALRLCLVLVAGLALGTLRIQPCSSGSSRPIRGMSLMPAYTLLFNIEGFASVWCFTDSELCFLCIKQEDAGILFFFFFFPWINDLFIFFFK